MTTHNHVSGGRMAARAEQRAHGVFDEAQTRIERLRVEAKARGQELLAKAKSRGDALIDEAQDRGRMAAESSREWIVENPGRAVGIAFVAGVIAHAWFTRRRGD